LKSYLLSNTMLYGRLCRLCSITLREIGIVRSVLRSWLCYLLPLDVGGLGFGRGKAMTLLTGIVVRHGEGCLCCLYRLSIVESMLRTVACYAPRLSCPSHGRQSGLANILRVAREGALAWGWDSLWSAAPGVGMICLILDIPSIGPFLRLRHGRHIGKLVAYFTGHNREGVEISDLARHGDLNIRGVGARAYRRALPFHKALTKDHPDSAGIP
jgi:hypothetical protein